MNTTPSIPRQTLTALLTIMNAKMFLTLVPRPAKWAVSFGFLANALTAQACWWDAMVDFSPTANPSPPWSSGWTAGLGSPLHLYPSVKNYFDGMFYLWYDPPVESLDTPSFWINYSDYVNNGVPPGFVSLHPGCTAAQFSVLRWTAPATGTHEIHAQFFAGDVGNTDAYILRNNDVGAPLFHTTSTDGNPSFSATVTLSSGDTIDFVVGTGGDGCYSDNTPLIARVTGAPLEFIGFLSPLGGADATGGNFDQPLETFKMNSIIPIRFGASCHGTAVETGIHTLQAIKYSDSTTWDAPIDASAPGTATTGNQFELKGSEWHFNLGTKQSGMSEGRWLLRATLSDGSQHSIWIQLK